MRRTTIILSAALTLLVLGPANALARHHARHHRSRAHHARLLRLGDPNSSPTSSSSADDAGTVASFTGGVLTINTSDGPIRGRVTDQTECTAPSQSPAMHEDGDNGGGDQTGDGDHSGSGDDQAQAPNDANQANEDQNEANENQAEEQNEANEANENQAEEQNEANEDQTRDEAAMSCTPANLPDGTVVREAELRISGAGNVWKKLELGS